MPKPLIAMNLIAAVGLFVSAQLLLPKRTVLDMVVKKQFLADRLSRERPELPYFYMHIMEKNEKGLWVPPSKEQIQTLTNQWAGHASGLEVELDFAQRALQARSISARRVRALFWIALGVVMINAIWSAAIVLRYDRGDKTAGESCGQA